MIYVILAYISYPLVFIVSRFFTKRRGDSFLVFQTAKVGDMICTTPVFREIKAARPGSRVGVVIDPVNAAVLKNNPRVDEIICLEKARQKGLLNKLSFAAELYKKGYSRALILLPNGANMLSAFWAMIPERVAVYPNFAGPTTKALLTLSTAVERHGEAGGRTSLETYLSALRHFGIAYAGTAKEVYTTPEAEKKADAYLKDALGAGGPLVGLCPSTANAMKNWGRQRFIDLGQRILDETDGTLVITGYREDGEVADAIISASGKRDRVVNAAGGFSLLEAPALMKRLDCVIGVDTGLIYMADALDVPVVDIAGPCDMKDQRPLGKKAFIVQERGLDCVPCSHTFRTPYECRLGHRRCITDITVDEVFKEVLKAIPRTKARAKDPEAVKR